MKLIVALKQKALKKPLITDIPSTTDTSTGSPPSTDHRPTTNRQVHHRPVDRQPLTTYQAIGPPLTYRPPTADSPPH